MRATECGKPAWSALIERAWKRPLTPLPQSPFGSAMSENGTGVLLFWPYVDDVAAGGVWGQKGLHLQLELESAPSFRQFPTPIR